MRDFSTFHPRILGACLIAVIGGSTRAQLAFTPLGHLNGPGGNPLCLAYGISGDGSTVVGFSRNESSPGFQAAFRWTAATGMEALTSFPPSGGGAYGASFDGSVIVGFFQSGAMRWTPATGPTLLPAPTGGGSVVAYGVSPDGLTIVGHSVDAQLVRHACYWAQGESHFLGDLPTWTSSIAFAVSSSGTVIVGQGQIGLYAYRPFRWTPTEGTVELPIPAGFTDAQARGVSADGTIVGGYVAAGSIARAVLWNGPTVTDLGVLPGQTSSTLLALTRDGSAAVGMSGQLSYIWTRTSGMLDLLTILAPVMPAGWSGFAPSGISDDGTRLSGYSANPATGMGEAVLVTIPPSVLCYANCDDSTLAPRLNVLDFGCFLNRFASGNPAANCDGSTTFPALNILDFACFLNKFAAGCG